MRALDASYVAGFLDGDGSIHFQLVRQGTYRFGFYARASMSFSQSTPARDGLEVLQTMIGGRLHARSWYRYERPRDNEQAAPPFLAWRRESVRAIQKRARPQSVAAPGCHSMGVEKSRTGSCYLRTRSMLLRP
jgi:hypothetical protein